MNMKRVTLLLIALLAVVTSVWADTTPDYLCFTAQEDDTQIFFGYCSSQQEPGNRVYLEYSTDKTTWNTYYVVPKEHSSDHYGFLHLSKAGDKVYFRAAEGGNELFSKSLVGDYVGFFSDKKIAASGNIMSLLDATCQRTSVPEDAFAKLFALQDDSYLPFYNLKSNLVSAPSLPATVLGLSCYSNMFENCDLLTTPPALPATNLAASCYRYMFKYCTALETAPSLPAPTLASSCYENMFYGCTKLSEAPNLPATTLQKYCYQYMFEGCTGLTKTPKLNATTLAGYCYCAMFRSCTGIKQLPELPATTLPEGCYSYMFANCTGLDYSSVLPQGKEWKLPADATMVNDKSGNTPLRGMFNNCKNDLPQIDLGVIYYDRNVLTDDYLDKQLVFYDGNTCNKSFNKVFKYRRSYTCNWQELFVPFALSYSDLGNHFDIAYISGVRHQDTNGDGESDYDILDVVKIKSGSTVPNKPYLIRYTGIRPAIADINVHGGIASVEAKSVTCYTTTATYTITGNYNALTSAYVTLEGLLTLGSEGSECNLSVDNTQSYGLLPQRWSMKVSDRTDDYSYDNSSQVSQAKRIVINVLNDDETTGISTRTTDNANAPMYNLSGQRVNDTAKGLVIKNGKKYIMK